MDCVKGFDDASGGVARPSSEGRGFADPVIQSIAAGQDGVSMVSTGAWCPVGAETLGSE